MFNKSRRLREISQDQTPKPPWRFKARASFGQKLAFAPAGEFLNSGFAVFGLGGFGQRRRRDAGAIEKLQVHDFHFNAAIIDYLYRDGRTEKVLRDCSEKRKGEPGRKVAGRAIRNV
jgi:hypothetical protein